MREGGEGRVRMPARAMSLLEPAIVYAQVVRKLHVSNVLDVT